MVTKTNLMKKKYKALFFGRAECVYSKKIYLQLKKFFYQVDVFWSKNSEFKPNNKILNWSGEYIFSFRSKYIIKQSLLKRASNLAINFHPGPPEYRGIGCVNFALFNNSKFYGSTVHQISNIIDGGKILDVKYFKIKKNIDDTLTKTYEIQYKQFLKILSKIQQNKKILPKKKYLWSKKIYKKKDLDLLYKIKPSFSRNKIKKILQSTLTQKFKPFVELHNYRFFYDQK